MVADLGSDLVDLKVDLKVVGSVSMMAVMKAAYWEYRQVGWKVKKMVAEKALN